MNPNIRDNDEGKERANLAERLRQAREYLGFSQDQVAQRLGIPRSALSNMETGQRKVEAVELKRLAELYQKPLTFFTGETAAQGEKLPADIEHLARKVSKLTTKDREELGRFADYLRSRSQKSGDNLDGSI